MPFKMPNPNAKCHCADLDSRNATHSQIIERTLSDVEDDPPAIDTNISDDGILVLSDSTTVTPVAENNSVVPVNEKQSAISFDKSTSVTAPTKEYNPFANTTKKKKICCLLFRTEAHL